MAATPYVYNAATTAGGLHGGGHAARSRAVHNYVATMPFAALRGPRECRCLQKDSPFHISDDVSNRRRALGYNFGKC